MYISIYRWDDAPQSWRDLSTCGGDEDYIAFVPDNFPISVDEMPFLRWGVFGNFVDEYKVPGGTILISSHA